MSNLWRASLGRFARWIALPSIILGSLGDMASAQARASGRGSPGGNWVSILWDLGVPICAILLYFFVIGPMREKRLSRELRAKFAKKRRGGADQPEKAIRTTDDKPSP